MNAPATDRSRWGCATGFAVLLVGTMTSGLATRGMTLSQPWTKEGVPVTVSKPGEAIFLAVGCVAGLACVAVVFSMVCLFLDGRGTLRQWQKGRRALLLVLLAAVVGLIAAIGAAAILNSIVSTMPADALDVLTDEIPANEDSYDNPLEEYPDDDVGTTNQ
ncbi:MAG TPA: hypothetical protein VND64_18350 [Pirellulales bacterium]|nr:hypothetical protein [Pirellulales bacterium]